MAQLSLLTWIGNAAAVLCGRHGAVSQQAHQAGCSRQAASDPAHQVQQAVADRHAGGPSRDQRLQDNQHLRADNRPLGAALEHAIDCPHAKQRPLAAVAAALGLSLPPTWVLLAIVLPAACCPSRATLGRWVQQAAAQATRLLQVLERACHRLVRTLGLEAIFWRRWPLLIGVEPRSLAWRLGQRGPDRTGPTWAQALTPWSWLTDVVADGGSGWRRGLAQVHQHGQEAGPQGPLETTRDHCHIQQEGQRSLRRQWHAAEHVGVAAEEADPKVAQVRRPGRKRSGPSAQARQAWSKAERAYETAPQRETAWKRAAALELFRPDGQLNDRSWASQERAAAVAPLPGERGAKTCRLRKDPQALTFLDRLARQWEEAEPRVEVRAAGVEWWRLQHRGRRPAGRPLPAVAAVVTEVVQRPICQPVAEEGLASAERVAGVLAGTVRASSVVECLNSVVRRQQARHRHRSQGLLDLKRLYGSCRSFAEGKRRDHCP